MSEPIFLSDHDAPEMQRAQHEARASFRYFWRELSWERRRIIPGLDLAAVKLPFTDGPRTDGHLEVEQMWATDVGFDGHTLRGTLLNAPNHLTSVAEGDAVAAPLAQLTDWLMLCGGRAYGGFTVNVIRAGMDRAERAQHDQAWGVDFGDPADVRIEMAEAPKPKPGLLAGLFRRGTRPDPAAREFSDHPMCVNMLPKIGAQLRDDPSLAHHVDDQGWTMLHHDALAGNLGVAKLLLAAGADRSARTPGGDMASDLARRIGWTEVADFVRP